MQISYLAKIAVRSVRDLRTRPLYKDSFETNILGELFEDSCQKISTEGLLARFCRRSLHKVSVLDLCRRSLGTIIVGELSTRFL